MKEARNNKDLSVKHFTTSFRLGDEEWVFEARRHHSPDPRFDGVLTHNAEHISEFVMIRSSIGKWLMTGNALPSEVLEHVQEIGKAFEEERSHLHDGHTSESIPGDKNMEKLTTAEKLPARGRESSDGVKASEDSMSSI